jgi:hypothetical protein
VEQLFQSEVHIRSTLCKNKTRLHGGFCFVFYDHSVLKCQR